MVQKGQAKILDDDTYTEARIHFCLPGDMLAEGKAALKARRGCKGNSLQRQPSDQGEAAKETQDARHHRAAHIEHRPPDLSTFP